MKKSNQFRPTHLNVKIGRKGGLKIEREKERKTRQSFMLLNSRAPSSHSPLESHRHLQLWRPPSQQRHQLPRSSPHHDRLPSQVSIISCSPPPSPPKTFSMQVAAMEEEALVRFRRGGAELPRWGCPTSSSFFFVSRPGALDAWCGVFWVMVSVGNV